MLNNVVPTHSALSSEDGDAPQPTETTPSSSTRLPMAWALFAGLVGPVVSAFCIALEPPPADPNAADPLIAVVLGLVLLVAMCGAAATSVQRRHVALSWATAVGALSMALTITCPLSGHHVGIGMWWVGQFVVSGAALGAALVGRYTLERA